MRPADAGDRPAVAQLFRARSAWMRNRGLEGWQGWGASAEELAAQAGDPDSAKVGPVWALTQDHRIVGVTTLYEQTPSWGWTDAERAQPSIFLATTCTDPAFAGQGLGCLIAWWALEHASERGFVWVRRGCGYERLMRYYRDVQGWDLVHTVQRKGVTAYLLARRAGMQPWLAETVATAERADQLNG